MYGLNSAKKIKKKTAQIKFANILYLIPGNTHEN